MDKYTKLYESGLAYIPSHKVKLLNNELVGEPITRLAQYESFGLEPAEIGLLISKNNKDFHENGLLMTITANIPLDRLQEICNAERDGRCVVLPCKVGDTVYEPFAGKVYEKTVDRIIINRFTTPQIWIETKLPFATPRLERWDIAIGKTVFLTREEAEKALKGGAE